MGQAASSPTQSPQDQFVAVIKSLQLAISQMLLGKTQETPVDYRQRYVDQQKNITNGPYQLGLAAYNWQASIGGDASYNDFIQTKVLDPRSKQIIDKIMNDFAVEYNSAKELVDTYNNQFINSRYIVDAYYEYLTKNTGLQKELDNTQQSILKNSRLSYYQGKNLQGVQKIEKYTAWLYKFLCFLCILGVLLYVDDYSIYQKIGISIGLLAYPYLIVYVLIPFLYWFFTVAHSTWDYFVHKDMYTYNGLNTVFYKYN